MWNVRVAIVLLGLLARSSVADDDNVFTNPTGPGPSGNFATNPEWKPGSVQRISWKTTLDAYEIALFHQKSKSGSGDQVRVVHTIDSNGSGDQSFDWTVDTYGTSTTSSSAFYFSVDSGSSDGFTSHYFNVTGGASTTTRRTTSASPSPTTSSIAAPRKTTTTTSAHHAGKTAAAAAPKPKSNPKPKKSKSKSAPSSSPRTLGLSIGLGLGASILVIGGFYAFYAIKESGPIQRRRQLAEDKKNAVPVWCPDEQVFKYSVGSAC
ncbi:uncharacterized protein J3D65DRAFT_24410 [Phyllosticta citribraziliensis]|uniref:Mid2 domain-containing protein n=1 Tax=Phyllosticta citribraziliensis TaxID=989973 RepID=A0ABR1M9J9_9PEZI